MLLLSYLSRGFIDTICPQITRMSMTGMCFTRSWFYECLRLIRDVNRSTVAFEDLPIDPIYTLAMDVPTSWLVRPREALYDLDNIQLGKLFPGDESVEAIFALDYIVIEGHARELSSRGEPPRGVQLQLSRSDGTSIDDTQVVANLGYFQFKAKPGVFHLDIRPGRGKEIFKLGSAGNEGWDSPSVEVAGNEITITSFEGITLYPRLSRLPGKESADVLKDDMADESHGVIPWYGGFVKRYSSLFSIWYMSYLICLLQSSVSV